MRQQKIENCAWIFTWPLLATCIAFSIALFGIRLPDFNAIDASVNALLSSHASAQIPGGRFLAPHIWFVPDLFLLRAVIRAIRLVACLLAAVCFGWIGISLLILGIQSKYEKIKERSGVR